MVSKRETDRFLTSERRNSSSKTCSRWWHQDFPHQQAISRTIESIRFQALVIFLVVGDTVLVITEIMLDSIKIHYECETDVHTRSKETDEFFGERLELVIEIAHFASIGILVFFVLELLVRIYAFGKEFWNIRRKKMEYFDAFIVITSLIIDLYLLRVERKILREQLILLFAFRLWRFVRIISSVAEGVRHGQYKHKEHLNKAYFNAVTRLVDLIKYKTNYINENSKEFRFASEHFRMIDNQIQTYLDQLDQNHELSSSVVVAQFIEQLNGIEEKTGDGSTIAAALIKPTHI